MTAARSSGDPVVILGAGYAGIAVWHEVHRRGRGRIPCVLVDRHPTHFFQTELYKLDQIAGSDAPARWGAPLREFLEGHEQVLRTGTVEKIDLESRIVSLDSGPLPYSQLMICLGSVPAYYGVPGAEANCRLVYGWEAARLLALDLRSAFELAARSSGSPLKIVVIGGGSTGTEVAAEIASADWSAALGLRVPDPDVTLVVGALPLLAGLPEGLVTHARRLLRRARVRLNEGNNVQRVDPRQLTLQDGTSLSFDVAVWAAGVRAPEVVRTVAAEHGSAGRLKVTENLEVVDRPGVFAIGDVAEFRDRSTGLVVPATAQAAMAEAPVATRNLLARRRGTPLRSFVYRERGSIVEIGPGAAAGAIRHVTIWGRPAALLKSLVEEGHRRSTGHGGRPPGL
ncbi:MAG: FAD-dependent oxidoreductase [Thermoplasmata archaeon]|nr:FAD-dependent oxidoreductase [Thermoplasmata archaeon]